MKAKLIFYWLTTGFIAVETFAGGVMDLVHGRTGLFSGPLVTDIVTSLGYPVYVLTILGIWKLPGAIFLVTPGFLRVKEWAYAGIVFELSGAAASHAFGVHTPRNFSGMGWSVSGHMTDAVAPLMFLCITVSSWALRPPHRILGGSLWPARTGKVAAANKATS